MDFPESDYIKHHVLSYRIKENGKINELAIMVGVNHPCYRFVKLFADMNRNNYKNSKMEE